MNKQKVPKAFDYRENYENMKKIYNSSTNEELRL